MTERELERRAQRRLAVLRHVEEVSGNVAAPPRLTIRSRTSSPTQLLNGCSAWEDIRGSPQQTGRASLTCC